MTTTLTSPEEDRVRDEIAEAVRERLAADGNTYAWVETRTGIPWRTVSRLLAGSRGEHSPTVGMLCDLLAPFGLTLKVARRDEL
jgi:hypothetical protein